MFARLHSGRSRPAGSVRRVIAGVQRGATSNDDRVGRFGISFYDRAGPKLKPVLFPLILPNWLPLTLFELKII